QVQAAATQAFLDVKEPARALPHADQYVSLARDSGDPQLDERAVKLRGAVNFTVKNYPAAAKDAADILKRNPNDAEAKQLYALSANRGDASGLQGAAPPQAAAPARPESSQSAGPDMSSSRKTMAQILTTA